MDDRHTQPRPYGGGSGHPTPHNSPDAQSHFQPPSTDDQPHHPEQQQQQQQQEQVFPSRGEVLEKADQAVAETWQEMLDNGESVSAWQVTQAALLTLKAGPSSALAKQMHRLPYLRELKAIEAKINAFIHCFVAVWGITTLYDLESAICKSVGIERFEDLDMGPFLQHPLVRHYFSLNGDVSEVRKISSEVVISYLNDYLYKVKGQRVFVEEFLDYVTRKEWVTGKEKLGVRIRNLGYVLHTQ